MSTTAPTTPATRPAAARGWGLVAAVALPPAVLLGLLGLLGGPVVAVVVLVVVAAGLAAWVWVGADRRVARAVGGRPADPRREARALNLIEGLSLTAGIHPPALVVVEAEGANLAVWGRDPARTTIAATTRLLADLPRIELEGILAAAVVEVRAGVLGPATLAAGLPGAGRRLVSSAEGRDARTDAAAARLTRFPPGLAAALERVAATGASVAAGGPDRAHLWLVNPAPAGSATPGRTAPADRAAALREL